MPAFMTFDEAIADSKTSSKRHLLLGNGFSIACKPDIFQYGSLFDRADFGSMPEAKNAFSVLGTKDFEFVIHAIENASRLFPVYSPDLKGVAQKIVGHAAAIKDILVKTIAHNHPEGPQDLDENELWACRRFLKHFLCDKYSHVFTLNYDLLLYWVLMNEGDPSDPFDLKANDGFGNDDDQPDAPYVVWQGESAPRSASVYYLHGALHLFDAGEDLQKYTWIRSGVTLVDQARSALKDNKFPLFVAEGTSHQKKERIRHHAYLYQGLKVLRANADQKNHCFFIYGNALHDNDNHILKRLGKGKFQTLYIGVYGDPESSDNKALIERANDVARMRDDRYPLRLEFFDAASANVWGRKK